jgi:signal transduction histidine kinase
MSLAALAGGGFLAHQRTPSSFPTGPLGKLLQKVRSLAARGLPGWKPSQKLPGLENFFIVPLAAGVLTALLMNLEFNLIESQLYDLRMRYSIPAIEPSEEIVLVGIDDQTLRKLEEVPPLGLELHARFLERIEKEYDPRAVGYLAELGSDDVEDPISKTRWTETADRFLQAAGRLESAGKPFLLGTRLGFPSEILPPFPLSSLPHSLAIIHRDGNVFPEDKVTRRALLRLHDKPVFHSRLARLVQPALPELPGGAFEVPAADAEYFFFRYRGDPAASEPARSGFHRVRFEDLLEGRTPREKIAGKIVLVGTEIPDDAGDFTFTPFEKAPATASRLSVHAQILHSILKDSGIRRADPWINGLLTLVSIALVLAFVLGSSPMNGVSATVLLAAMIVIGAQIAFSSQGLWIRESQPLVGVFLGYYLGVPYRLLREHQKRWEYQRKNEILLQVEELKRNFLSLVTHDLKTPVARIQGLAEVLLRKAQERLVERDRETLQAIISATDELNRFISSILELSKLESSRLRLHLESRDVNDVLERVTESFKAPARARNIRITTEFEPLFPIRFDVGLISKVFNNLVDNALKYSPEGSELKILSRELDPETIEIRFIDQGIGLSETEKSQLFQRFYRAKNDATTRTSGTGLGLYLSRYFVEAHGGSITVESEPGKGSEFILRLPQSISTALEPQTAFVSPPLDSRNPEPKSLRN